MMLSIIITGACIMLEHDVLDKKGYYQQISLIICEYCHLPQVNFILSLYSKTLPKLNGILAIIKIHTEC